MTRVTVIIPVKDDPRVFDAVRSVLRCAGEVESLQLLVVDNASEPSFAAELSSKLQAPAEMLREDQLGVYRARNRGIAQAKGDVVVFTDADCVVRPGWLAAALAALDAGADLVQGYSASLGNSKVEGLLQSRYEAHLRKLRPGDGTECDTRNLAVRASVFKSLKFNDQFRRVSDTEFGLLAEATGFRVCYAPAMRVDHAHDTSLRVFAAKQVCHGWGAQRLMQQHPEIRWHGGHLKLVARVTNRLTAARFAGFLAPATTWFAMASGGMLERSLGWLPFRMAFWGLTAVDKLAALGGHLAYRQGAPEPSPSELLGRSLARD